MSETALLDLANPILLGLDLPTAPDAASPPAPGIDFGAYLNALEPDPRAASLVTGAQLVPTEAVILPETVPASDSTLALQAGEFEQLVAADPRRATVVAPSGHGNAHPASAAGVSMLTASWTNADGNANGLPVGDSPDAEPLLRPAVTIPTATVPATPEGAGRPGHPTGAADAALQAAARRADKATAAAPRVGPISEPNGAPVAQELAGQRSEAANVEARAVQSGDQTTFARASVQTLDARDATPTARTASGTVDTRPAAGHRDVAPPPPSEASTVLRSSPSVEPDIAGSERPPTPEANSERPVPIAAGPRAKEHSTRVFDLPNVEPGDGPDGIEARAASDAASRPLPASPKEASHGIEPLPPVTSTPAKAESVAPVIDLRPLASSEVNGARTLTMSDPQGAMKGAPEWVRGFADQVGMLANQDGGQARLRLCPRDLVFRLSCAACH